MVTRREAREPLAYIVGHREFFSLEFEVRPGVLIPRPETETVVEAALDFLRERERHWRASAVGAVRELPPIAPRRFSISEPARALSQSRSPRTRLGYGSSRWIYLKCRVKLPPITRGAIDAPIGSLFSKAIASPRLKAALPLDPFDLMVSNPPYIAEAEFAALAPEVRDFERGSR